MRIGSEAPRRRTHSPFRHESHGNTSGPRHLEPSSATPSQVDGLGRNCWVPSASSVHDAGRRTTPSGTTPSRTNRHKAIRRGDDRRLWDVGARGRYELGTHCIGAIDGTV